MDPTATLTIILNELDQERRRKRDGHGDTADREALMQALLDLHEWIENGGFLPDAEKAVQMGLGFIR